MKINFHITISLERGDTQEPIRDDDKAETQIAEPRPVVGFQPSDVDA